MTRPRLTLSLPNFASICTDRLEDTSRAENADRLRRLHEEADRGTRKKIRRIFWDVKAAILRRRQPKT